MAVAVQPWAKYAAGSDVQHFTEFCRDHCFQAIEEWEDEPLELEPWQAEMFGEALAYDDAGMPVWRRVVLCIPRKNGKTTALAAFGVYKLLTSPGSPEVLLAASTDEQAKRLYDAAASFIARDSMLRELLNVRDYKGRIDRVDGKGVIYRVSAESGDLDGYNASLVIPDELHAWQTPTQRRGFAKLVSGGGARKRNRQLFTITTAGDAQSRESSILGRLIDGAIAKGEVVRVPGLEVARHSEGSTLVYNYTAPTKDPSDVDAMKLANPASWIDTDFLAEAAASDDLTTSEKLRYHGGVWAESADTFVGRDEWVALGTSGAIPEGSRVALGLDGSRTHDTTVVAWAALDEDDVMSVDARVFSVRSEAPHHELHSGSIDYEAVEEFVVDRFGLFDVAEAAFDPRYLQRSADILSTRLAESQIVAVEPSSRFMRDALAAFYRRVKDGTLRHRGDPVLLEHVVACKGEQDERGWIVRKRKQSAPIDAVIAMALAVWRAEQAPAEAGFEAW